MTGTCLRGVGQRVVDCSVLDHLFDHVLVPVSEALVQKAEGNTVASDLSRIATLAGLVGAALGHDKRANVVLGRRVRRGEVGRGVGLRR